MNTKPPRKKRAYSRESIYPAVASATVTAEVRAALEAEADAASVPLAAVIRDVIARGLPLVRDARRKRTSS